MMTNVPYPPFIGFIVNGITFFAFPALWLTDEGQSIDNDVQQAISVQYAPAIIYSGTTYSIRIEIPLGNIFLNTAVRTLKSLFKKSSETLASNGEEYNNIDYTQEIDPSEVGKIISPWRKRDDPLDASEISDPDNNASNNHLTNYLEDGRRALLTGFIGISHQCMGGYLKSFHSDTQVRSMKEIWSITIDGINLSVLRNGPPDPPEKPEVPSNAPAGGYTPTHGILPQMI